MTDNSIGGATRARRETAYYLPCLGDQDVGSVLDALDRLDDRNTGRHPERRGESRRRLRALAVLKVFLPGGYEMLADLDTVTFGVWTRNISTTGVGVVCSDTLLPQTGVTDQAPLIQLPSVLTVGDSCLCGIILTKPTLSFKWLSARVARMRPLQANMVEIGVQFLLKLDAPQIGLTDSFQQFVQDIVDQNPA